MIDFKVESIPASFLPSFPRCSLPSPSLPLSFHFLPCLF